MAKGRAELVAILLAAAGAAPAAAEGPTPRSRIVWTADVEGFGGFSGIELTDGGESFLAVSDRGLLVKARLRRDQDGRMSGAVLTGALRPLDNAGRPVEGFHSDAEAVRIGPGGTVFIAFEGYARVAGFRLPDPDPTPLHVWDRFRDLWGNEGMESLAIAPGGQIVTILEKPRDDGGYPMLLFRGGTDWVDGPRLPSDGTMMATDADFGPDGRLYVLERAHSLIWGFSSRISVYDRAGTGYSRAGTVLATNAGLYGDLEGLDVWRDGQGRTVLTLISDDNFAPGAETEIVEYVLAP